MRVPMEIISPFHLLRCDGRVDRFRKYVPRNIRRREGGHERTEFISTIRTSTQPRRVLRIHIAIGSVWKNFLTMLER